MNTIDIRMLGEFSISTETQQLCDTDNRSRKVWILLAYLIYHRNRVVNQDELMTLLWDDASASANPSGALKTIFHRARATLDRLWPRAGHELILRQGGGYIWNSDIPVTLDVDRFDELCRMEDLSEAEQLQQALDALSPEHRQIFLLRQMRQLSYDEIGRLLGLESGTVKSRLSRAKKQLRQILTEKGNLFAPPSVLEKGEEEHHDL